MKFKNYIEGTNFGMFQNFTHTLNTCNEAFWIFCIIFIIRENASEKCLLTKWKAHLGQYLHFKNLLSINQLDFKQILFFLRDIYHIEFDLKQGMYICKLMY